MSAPHLDLTPFGFTPTESLIYEVLLTGGPGTGYAIARTAGLARANAYAALEGLVGKGAARSEEGKPKRYRPEPPTALLARIMDGHGAALDTLSATLEQISVPASPTLVAVSNARGALQLISHETARARESVHLLAPADAYPVLTPALRRAAGAGVALSLWSTGAVSLPFAQVAEISVGADWPGQPVILAVDGRSALLASRDGDQVDGHWGTAPTLVSAALLAMRALG
ncbi:MAG: helix-turn-helix domain-containing protein [Gemmatimonadota bacterium]|nr:helix-turn-helix domain-containing protein [Gemmatimonadota bacterium]